MNVCFLLSGFTVNGGIGRVVSILVNQLCKEEHTLFAISFYDTKMPGFFAIDPKVKQDNLFGEALSMKSAIVKGGIQKLRRYLIENDIDIVVACGALYYPIAILACIMIKTKCICWEHGNTQTLDEYAFQRMCRRFGARHGDYIVVLTKSDMKNYVAKYDVSNIKQIYNPVDQILFMAGDAYNQQSKKIISVGRLAPPKNYSALIDMANVLLTRHKDWTWDIYGDGELREELQQKISALQLEKQLILKGQTDDIYQRYKDYSFLVMTSIREGFPMVLLEAAANSLPLVSFDIETGPSEIITNGENGFLIKANDTEEMIRCIEKLMNSDDLRTSMSRNSRITCDKFAQEKIVGEWRGLIEMILHKS